MGVLPDLALSLLLLLPLPVSHTRLHLLAERCLKLFVSPCEKGFSS